MKTNSTDFILVGLMIAVFSLLASCMTVFKLMTPDGEASVIDRETRRSCPKLYEGTTEGEKYAVYGEPCQVEIRNKLKE